MDEEKENLPATNIDDVTLSFDNVAVDNHKSSPTLNNRSDDKHLRSDQNSPRTSQHNNSHRSNGNTSAPVAAPRPSINQGRGPQTGASSHGDIRNNRNDAPEKDPRRDAVESQLQNMFLDTVPGNRARQGNGPSPPSQQRFYPPPMMERAKNGHNNNNNNNVNSTSLAPPPATPTPVAPSTNNQSNTNPRSSFRDTPRKRFVAPPHSAIVGGEDDEKEACCVIL